MATTTKKSLEKILTERLELDDPEFYLEKLSDGKLSGNVISDTFDGLDHLDRQRKIWQALEEEFGDEFRERVGTLLAYTRAEWYIPLQGDVPTAKRRRKTR